MRTREVTRAAAEIRIPRLTECTWIPSKRPWADFRGLKLWKDQTFYQNFTYLFIFYLL